jgi:lipoprotein NlpD
MGATSTTRRGAGRAGWIGALLALALAGCATVNEAPVDDRTIDPGPAVRAVRDAAPSAPERAVPPPAGEHAVAQGDTLYGIAFRHGLDFRALAAWNAIPPPYTIRVGQRLRLTPPPAPVAATPAPSPALPPPRETVIARPATLPDEPPPEGEAQTYAIGDPAGAAPPLQTEADVAAVPGATLPVSPSPPPSSPVTPTVAPPPAPPRPAPSRDGPLGRAIAGDATAPPPGVTRPPGSAPATPPAAPRTAAPRTPPVSAVPAVPSAGPATASPAEHAVPSSVDAAAPAAPIAAAATRQVGGVAWRWPASGTLLLRFAPGDPARQGIDIQGKAGAPVLAAADGEVVYSGNGLVGYGELVIIKHSPEFLSAYGHNRKRLVAEGQKVRAGQAIAELGRSPAGLDALHFEIRRSGKPIDPLQILPPR